jgi:hypothetical protein
LVLKIDTYRRRRSRQVFLGSPMAQAEPASVVDQFGLPLLGDVQQQVGMSEHVLLL